MARLAVFALSIMGSLVCACSSVDGYTTAPGESLCGGLPGPTSFTTGLSTKASMRLTFDATQLDGEGSPGTLWTYEPASSASVSRRLLDGVPLEHIPAIDSDPLGSPDLGSGRDQTRLFSVVPSAPDEAALVAAVSLRSDGNVEVRLLRPGQVPIFGLFTLTKQAGTCGF